MNTTHSSVASKVLVFLIAITLPLGVAVLAAPEAEAQMPRPELLIDIEVRVGAPCPQGTSKVGTAIFRALISTTWCRPNGYAPGVSAADCGTLSNDYLWERVGPCIWDDWAPLPGQTCDAPAIPVIGRGLSFPPGFVACALPVLKYVGVDDSVPAAEPACIETDLVQGDKDLADRRVGDRFTNDDGVVYEIATGSPCNFDCHGGFDMNCDGKLGDFCAIELDRKSVKGANACLKALAADNATPQATQ